MWNFNLRTCSEVGTPRTPESPDNFQRGRIKSFQEPTLFGTRPRKKVSTRSSFSKEVCRMLTKLIDTFTTHFDAKFSNFHARPMVTWSEYNLNT